jgi:hypothetical protein
MSDEQKPGEGAQAPQTKEPGIQELKSEFTRKIDNLAKQQSELLGKLASLTKPAQPEQKAKPKLSEQIFDDPESAIAEIERRAEERVMSRISSQQKTSSVLAELAADFPELADEGSDLTQKATKIYSSFSEAERALPLAYKAAVQQAALEVGVKPSKFRPKEQYTSTGKTKNVEKNSSEMDEGQKYFMDQMVASYADPEKKKALLSRLKSKGYK